MARSRRVLVSGLRAKFWKIRDDTLVLFHPSGRDHTEVPVPHLADENEFLQHVWRLRDKRWVSEAAVQELYAIRAGWRR